MGTTLGRIAFLLLFGGAGLFLLNLARLLFLKRRQWLRDGIVVEGTVIGLHERQVRSAKSRVLKTYAPAVSFSFEGQERQFTSSQSTSDCPYRIGDQVKVRYLPGDPQSADLDAVTRAVWVLLGVLFLGAMCLLVGTLPFLLNRGE